MSVNKVFLLGNVGQDPEIKRLEGNNCLAKFSLATSEKWKDREGNKREITTWHNCEVWGVLAEKVVEPYVKAGTKLYIEGKIKVDSWDDEHGNNRKAVKIQVLSLQILSSKPDDMGKPSTTTQKPQQVVANAQTDEDDLPF